MKIVHTALHPLAAKKFVEPLAISLINQGHDVEIWVKEVKAMNAFYDAIDVPKKVRDSDLSANLIKVIANALMLFKYIWNDKPDILAAHFSRGAFLPLLVAFLLRVPRRVYHNHGVPHLGYTGLYKTLFKILDICNCFFSTEIITVSESMASELKLLSQRRSVQVLGSGSACGIDKSYFESSENKDLSELRGKLGIEADDFVMIYVGRPVKRKGFFDIIEAFELLNTESNLKVKLLMAGISSKDLKLANSQKSNKNIIALGFIENLELYYEISRVLILPSYHEGLPYCILEASAKKNALIVSKLPGFDSLVNPGLNGYFIEVGDIQSLKNYMLKLYNNPSLVEKMSLQSYSIAKEFERSKVMASYNKLMSK